MSDFKKEIKDYAVDVRDRYVGGFKRVA